MQKTFDEFTDRKTDKICQAIKHISIKVLKNPRCPQQHNNIVRKQKQHYIQKISRYLRIMKLNNPWVKEEIPKKVKIQFLYKKIIKAKLIKMYEI